MKPLSSQNIESELSYAYLHAVAAHAGIACSSATRHEDNVGIDARLLAVGPFDGGGYLNEVDVKVQLKATISTPVTVNGCFSYALKGISQYDDLRAETSQTARILVLLYLPPNPDDWLALTDDALIMRKCAYWVSLRGASASQNSSSQQIYIPTTQRFDAIGLKKIVRQLSHRTHLTYAGAENA